MSDIADLKFNSFPVIHFNRSVKMAMVEQAHRFSQLGKMAQNVHVDKPAWIQSARGNCQ